MANKSQKFVRLKKGIIADEDIYLHLVKYDEIPSKFIVKFTYFMDKMNLKYNFILKCVTL